MRYISDKRLKELIIRNPGFDTFNQTLLNLIDRECKELPDQQWQTIDEFKVNTVGGWCWIKLINDVGGNTEMAYFNEDSCFYENMFCMDTLNVSYITHVMPIKTPEAPK